VPHQTLNGSRPGKAIFLCARISQESRRLRIADLDDLDRQVKIGKLLPHHDQRIGAVGIRRSWRELSSASKTPDLACADISSHPRLQRHMVGANAATAGSQRGCEETPGNFRRRLGVGPGSGSRSIPLPADHRPVAADIWSIDFCQRCGGGEVCRDIDALARPQPFEKARSRTSVYKYNRSRVRPWHLPAATCPAL